MLLVTLSSVGVQTALSGAMIGKGNYRHFMEKEIHEQPAVIGDTLHSMLNPATQHLPPTEIDLTSVPASRSVRAVPRITPVW